MINIIGLPAQHAEVSNDRLGLSCACVDADSGHAKTGSQRCLTHPIHLYRRQVALSIENKDERKNIQTHSYSF